MVSIRTTNRNLLLNSAVQRTFKRVHVNQFILGKDSLENYQILMFPGGFCFGDHLGSGRVLANKFRYSLHDDLTKFIEAGKLILGICNGFQVLVKMGILPAFDNSYYDQTVTLVGNKSGQFECRWVRLTPHESRCIWTQGFDCPFTCACSSWGRSIHNKERRNVTEIVG